MMELAKSMMWDKVLSLEINRIIRTATLIWHTQTRSPGLKPLCLCWLMLSLQRSQRWVLMLVLLYWWGSGGTRSLSNLPTVTHAACALSCHALHPHKSESGSRVVGYREVHVALHCDLPFLNFFLLPDPSFLASFVVSSDFAPFNTSGPLFSYHTNSLSISSTPKAYTTMYTPMTLQCMEPSSSQPEQLCPPGDILQHLGSSLIIWLSTIDNRQSTSNG